jgi:hypothetical protein
MHAQKHAFAPPQISDNAQKQLNGAVLGIWGLNACSATIAVS